MTTCSRDLPEASSAVLQGKVYQYYRLCVLVQLTVAEAEAGGREKKAEGGKEAGGQSVRYQAV
jgi:hypothetical protein